MLVEQRAQRLLAVQARPGPRQRPEPPEQGARRTGRSSPGRATVRPAGPPRRRSAPPPPPRRSPLRRRCRRRDPGPTPASSSARSMPTSCAPSSPPPPRTNATGPVTARTLARAPGHGSSAGTGHRHDLRSRLRICTLPGRDPTAGGDMAVEVRAVVSRGRGEPVGIETVLVPDPGPGEAVVDVEACGVCHTDLHYREGGISDDYPFLLGHEAAGRVSTVGAGVTDVAPGDFVILNWRAVCGSCRACARGRPWYCFATHNATQRMTLDRRHRPDPRAGDRRSRREDTGRGRAVHEGRPGGAGDGGGAARLRGDGRDRRGDQHRCGHPRRHGRRLRLRRRRHGGGRRRAARRRAHGRRRRRGPAEAGRGAATRRDTRGQLPGGGSGGGGPRGHRRLRRGRVHRGGRPAGDVPAGLLRP